MRAIAGSVMLAAAFAAQAQPPQYVEWVVRHEPGFEYAYPVSINDRGDFCVSEFASDPNADTRAKVYLRSSGYVALPFPAPGYCIAINNRGDVIVEAPTGTFLYSREGASVPIEAPAGYDTLQATGFNDRDAVVGTVNSPSTGTTRVFSWTRERGVTVYDDEHVVEMSNAVINDAGAVAFYDFVQGFGFRPAVVSGSRRGFIPTDGAAGVRPVGINLGGEVALLGGGDTACTWSAGRGFTCLPGGISPVGISDDGWIAAAYFVGSGDVYPIIWNRDAGMFDIRTLIVDCHCSPSAAASPLKLLSISHGGVVGGDVEGEHGGGDAAVLIPTSLLDGR